jgi:hypothetical protein
MSSGKFTNVELWILGFMIYDHVKRGKFTRRRIKSGFSRLVMFKKRQETGANMSSRPTFGHFTRLKAKVIVSDYRYFLNAIFDATH